MIFFATDSRSDKWQSQLYRRSRLPVGYTVAANSPTKLHYFCANGSRQAAGNSQDGEPGGRQRGKNHEPGDGKLGESGIQETDQNPGQNNGVRIMQPRF